ncbi:type I polyketide synthase [Kitasatospora sp. LaBMicrA B282]|uniref:type I polyketide synthase n=1 Tax=Kitasatospora sp. LaBMicrA B282 TaxID=3420949 RepID=UPI003D0BC8AA
MSTDSGQGSTPASAAESAVAIVGVGCRFPGGVRSLDSFGRLLTRAPDVFTPVPADRWEAERSDPNGGPGRIANGMGAFLPDIDRFDAPFFGVSPREAGLLDPQQRLVLEVAWEAMSDAGRTREQWAGSRTAVVLGLLAKDYELLHARTLGTGSIGQHHVSGLEFSFAAGRLAYTFDLTGPVSAVNSACSSSLLAVHQACQLLRSGECDTAVAGGVSLLITPDISIFLSRVGALSPSGRCRPFDAAADGIVRGEGAGVVVLKRLADALADGDRIHAVIRGSAANNDGTSMGLTVPNAAAQADLLELALRRAGLAPAEVDYVEAHGTGTAIGDVIEVDAIGEVYGADRGTPLLVGSHKALLGHMDAAAGIGGLLKSTWVVNSGTVPRQPHVDRLNPGVNWRDGVVTVPSEHTAIGGPDRPARAGVSAFGLSGTNVHVIVEAPPTAPAREADRPGHPYVLLASAGSAAGLAEQLGALRESVAATEPADLADLAASSTNRRTHESHRYAVVAADRAQLLEVLADPTEPQDGGYPGVVLDPESAPEPVFVYSGQGGQWPGMALDLYRDDPVVRAALDECAELISATAGWQLLDELRGADPAAGLNRTEIVQPAIFAVQVALTRWLADKGVRPGAIVGHSLGEVAAAHAAGVLSLPDAITLIVRRSETLGLASGWGLMHAVTADEETVTAVLAETGLPVTVVAVNGPTSLVVAGPAAEVGQAAAALEARGLRCRQLRVDAPAHSPLIGELGPRLGAALAGLRPAAPAVRLLSTVDPDATDLTYDAGYWVRNFTSPVRFWPAIDRLLAEDDHPLVEIGPHPVLVPSLTEAQRLRGRQAPALPVLSRYEPGRLAGYRALARLHAAGTPVRWPAAVAGPVRYRTLPVPSWGGDRYWLPGVPRGSQGVTDPQRAGAVGGGPAKVRISLLDEHDRVTGEAYARLDAGAGAAAAAVAAVAPAPAVAPVTPVAPAAPLTPPVPPVPVAVPPAPSAAAAGRAGGLVELVTDAVREVLGLPAGQPVARRRGLFEQGLDSLTAVALRRRLEQQLGLELPSTIVFERPTVAALAEHLAELAPHATAPAATPTPEPAAAPIPEPAATQTPEQPDGIAVIGMSCRLPGAASPEQFWDLLNTRTTTAGKLPADRLRDPIWAELGDTVAPRGSYLPDLAQFDAPFFRISPREAALLDPQQRLFLETAWEALEHAGCPAHTLAERPVGVYAGLSMADYQYLVARAMPDTGLTLHQGTGTSFAALAGRLSYVLGLRGPSMAVDTACSASLTAVHLACQALRSGDCEVAVVGGASAIVAPSPLIASMAGGGALSPDGRCKAFDEAADGFGCGEGAVVLVLKPLAAALRDGDRVHAVLRGSAVNQDGATGGLTVPNPAAQADVVRRAVERAGWAPHEVDYVETHGTGTPLGDPIEVSALAAALGADRDQGDPLLIGSAKANVGHLGAAAGAVGLLKVVLALRHGQLPPHVLDRPSSRIDWERLPVALVTDERPWPTRQRPARAGVSAFGFSGSNAHVVVEQFVPAPAERPAAAGGDQVLLATAATPQALAAVARGLADRLTAAPEQVAGIAFTATRRRSLLDHRLAVVGPDAATLAAALRAAADGRPTADTRLGRVDSSDEATLAFHYPDELPAAAVVAGWAAGSSEYRRQAAELAQLLAEFTGVPVGTGDAEHPALRPARVFCHQAAATAALRHWGVVPHAATGLGAGAVTAAWARGELTTAAALRHLLPGTDPTGAPGEALAGPAEPRTAADCDRVLTLPSTETTPARLVAELFATGHRPATPDPAAGTQVDLPGYPWDHQPYWYREFPLLPTTCWTLSAGSAAELRARAGRLHEALAGSPAPAAAVGQALALRPGEPHRLTLVGEETGGLLADLAAFAERGETPASAVTGVAPDPARPVLVFPGQGWQWDRMGAELLDSSPVFAAAIAECSAVVEQLAGWSVPAVLRGEPDAPSFERVDVVQPVMFSVMLGLARLWESAGVVPAAVIGHSQGEIAAACVAGVLSVPDAMRVVVARSAALVELAGHGAMLSVAAGLDTVTELLDDWSDRLWVAAVNGPSSTVVAGEVAAAEEFMAACKAAEVRVRRIPVDYASHTPQVESIGDRVLAALGRVEPRPGRVPMYSTVTGAELDTTTMDAAYWLRNLRSRVRFQDATEALLDAGFTVFVEASAHPVLTVGIEETAEARGLGDRVTVSGTLRRTDGGLPRLLTGAARLWTAGVPVAWPALLPADADGTALDLPLDTPADDRAAAPDLAEQRFWRLVEQADPAELAGLLGLDAAAERDSLGAVLPALSRWWQQRRETAVVNSWRYRIGWRPLATGAEPGSLTGTWFVVAPAQSTEHDLVTACLRAIGEHGGKPVLLPLDAAHPEPAALVEALTEPGDQPISGVLSLLALDESAHPEHPVVPAGLLATVVLLQAMEAAGCDAKLWSATSGAVATGPADALTSPTQAHLWGLNRVAGLENPQRLAGLLDLPPVLDARAAQLLCTALAGIADEDQLALRPTGLLARRILRAPVAADAPGTPWRPSGTLLVTGGTGALGGHVARWLSRQGGHLLLVSRQGAAAPGAAELHAELTGLGAASVTLAACDLADRAELARVLAAVPADRPLTGVFHTAGVVDDGPVNELTADQLERVLLPKTRAVQNLDELTADLDLSAFVLYSSAGNLIPNVGQAAYAAGNAYLDAFAEHRRARGKVATSIAWGAWAGRGMAEDQGFIDWLSLGGMDLMTPHLGVMALLQALAQDDTTVTIANVDWDRFAERFGATRPHPFVAEVRTRPADRTPAEQERPDRLAQLAALEPERRRTELLDLVLTELATVLGHASARSLDPGTAFKDLGIDSVTAIELRNRVSGVAGLRFSPIAVFDHPNAAALTEHLLDRFPTPAEAPAPAEQPAAAPNPAGESAETSRIDEMAVEDLVRMARGAHGS